MATRINGGGDDVYSRRKGKEDALLKDNRQGSMESRRSLISYNSHFNLILGKVKGKGNGPNPDVLWCPPNKCTVYRKGNEMTKNHSQNNNSSLQPNFVIMHEILVTHTFAAGK